MQQLLRSKTNGILLYNRKGSDYVMHIYARVFVKAFFGVAVLLVVRTHFTLYRLSSDTSRETSRLTSTLTH